jgi:hypothetical protein
MTLEHLQPLQAWIGRHPKHEWEYVLYRETGSKLVHIDVTKILAEGEGPES